MRLQRLRASLLALTLVAPLTSHGAGLDDPGREAFYKTLAGKRVVFIPVAMSYDMAEGWSSGLMRDLQPLGVKFEIRDPNWSTAAGAQAITSLIAEKPDVIVVNNPDVQSYSRLLQKAEEAGIHVIQINMRSNSPAGIFVGADWVRLGEMTAQAAVESCKGKSGKIAVIQGVLTSAASAYQAKGITNVIDKHPEMKVVSNQAADWDASKAKSIASTVLQQHRDLCAVIGFWDAMDVGTAAAIREAGQTGKVSMISSGGAARSACEAVRSGLFDYYVSFDVPGQTRDMSTLIKTLLQSRNKAGTVHASLYTPLVPITKANAGSDAACWGASKK